MCGYFDFRDSENVHEIFDRNSAVRTWGALRAKGVVILQWIVIIISGYNFIVTLKSSLSLLLFAIIVAFIAFGYLSAANNRGYIDLFPPVTK